MAQANAGLPEERWIVLRIGINLGEVLVEGDDLFGDGVNIAARLESLAPPGGVLVSGSARDQVHQRIAGSLEDLGMRTLKNIAEPVHVYQLQMPSATSPSAGANAASGSAPAVPPRQARRAGDERTSIAILPFSNLGDDVAQGHFSDGVTEDLITELSRWRILAVRSRAASFRYRGLGLDIAQVARELDVRYLVEGSVRRLGDRIRISAQLIDSETGAHLWADKFDRPAGDVFAVQDEVVQTIVSTLAGRVNVSDVARARRKPPASLAAYDCVVQGNALPWGTPEGLAEAARWFERAVEIDPGYAFALAVLGFIRHTQWFEDESGSDRLLDEAHALASRATQLDECQSTAFSVLAQACLSRRAFDLAREHIEHAVSLNPSNQWNLADMGVVLTGLGEHERAIECLLHAREIDRFFDTPWYWRGLGQACLLLGRDEQALVWLGHAPTDQYRTVALLAACHARLGDADAAARLAAVCVDLKPGFSIAAQARKDVFRRPQDTARMAEAYRLAGLPE
jgi:TolB-like protein